MTLVLVVEDQANARKFITANLSARGYDVVEAQDGVDGLEKLREYKPDVVILDIRMPVMSGLELLAIKTGEPDIADIPVVVMTASEASVEHIQENDPQIVEMLIKPVGVSRLLSVVSQALHRS